MKNTSRLVQSPVRCIWDILFERVSPLVESMVAGTSTAGDLLTTGSLDLSTSGSFGMGMSSGYSYKGRVKIVYLVSDRYRSLIQLFSK